MADSLSFFAAVFGALAVGAVAGFLVQRLVSRERIGSLEARCRETEDARTRLIEAQSRVTQLETTLTHERRATEEKLAVFADAQQRLTDAFKALSADALDRNSESFLKLARTSFEKLQEQSKGDLAKRQQAIDSMVKPIKESLEKVDKKVAEIESARARAYGKLGEQLEQLSMAQARLQAEAAKLSTALRSTSYAGSWGELQLRRVVEMADMLSHVDFIEQETSGALRADMVVRLPGGQRIVVDAKSPLQSYREALDATDEAVRQACAADHAQKVRSHIDALGAKSYWEQFQPAPEFVVLFMPGDHFLTAALQTDPTLLERAVGKRVLLATPITLIALLKAAAYGWRQEAVSQNAAEISEIGNQLYDRLATFADHLGRVGRGLEAATRSYNQAVGSFEASIMPGARRFPELGAKGKGAKALTPPPSVETAAREVTKRE